MPKPMIGNKQNTQNNSQVTLSISPVKINKQMTQTEKMKLDRLLRAPRSKQYMDSMTRLDAGGHVHNKDKVNDIIDILRAEFPEVSVEDILLGVVAPCYLGAPYEVHTLDISGSIIEHFKVSQTLPGGLEKARSIAIRGGYAFIEVYADCCRAISDDGSVSVIPC